MKSDALRPNGPAALNLLDAPAYFEVFCEERVNLTSTLFAGGDWRWKLHSSDGYIVAHGDGYANQEDCRRAVDALRNDAATAQLRTNY